MPGVTGMGPLPSPDPGPVAEQFVLAWSYVHTTAATTTVVKTGAGHFHGIMINTLVAGAITIYDNTAASGTVIAVITLPAAGAGDMPCFLPFDVAFATGLTIVTAQATDLTVTYL